MRQREVASGLITALWMAVFVIRGAAQQPAPPAQFRAGTDLVQVEVSVLDHKRQPVRGLTAADFTLLDNGLVRPIDAFTEVRLPDRSVAAAPAAWTRDVPPDVVANTAAQDEGRIVVILMDRSISIGPPTYTAKKVATRLVEELGPTDLAAIVSTSGGMTQNLTSDKPRLLKAITQAGAGTRSSQDIVDTDALTAWYSFTPMNEGECLCGLCVLDTITRVARAVEDVSRRRKSLFFIGSNLVFQSADSPDASSGVGCGIRLNDARDVMFAAIDRANLTIHSIDPTGLEPTGPTSRASSNLPGRSSTTLAAQSRQTEALTENLAHQNALRVLPSHTGGRVVLNTNTPEEMVPAMLRESDGYYVLGFRPSASATGTDFRKVQVKVARSDVQVHARSGYQPVAANTATPEKTSATSPVAAPTARSPLTAALETPLPNADVPLSLGTAVFATPGSPRATVAVTVGLDRATGALGPAGSSGPVEFLIGAFDRQGRPVASAHQTTQVAWPADGPTAPRRLDLLSHIDLKPGEYEIRVAVTGTDATRASSVFSFVTVPDFDAAPLSLSTIAVGGSAGTSALKDDDLAARLPFMPTTQRAFSTADQFVAFFRVYQGTRRTEVLSAVNLRIALVDAQGQTAASQAATLAPDQFAGRSADYFVRLPLSGLASGDYLLRVEAAAGKDLVAGRVVRFQIAAR